MARLSPTEAKVVKAKIKAEITDTPQYVVAREVFPHQTAGSAAVSMSQELRKPNVQEALQEALAKHDLTADRLAVVVNEAMNATRAVTGKDNEVVARAPDHSIRLKAAGMAANWMGVGKGEQGGTTNLNFINLAKSDKDEFGI